MTKRVFTKRNELIKVKLPRLPKIKKKEILKFEDRQVVKKAERERKKKIPKAKYKHTATDYRNYKELVYIGATKHKEGTKALIKTLDKLHSLLDPRCKSPIKPNYIPEEYEKKQWTIDEVIETFKFHLENAEKGFYINTKKIKNIGQFIFTEGYNGYRSWSPLIFWHKQYTGKGIIKLTKFGERLKLSLEKEKIETKELTNDDLNVVGKRVGEISDQMYYWFNDGMGSTKFSYFARYVKQQLNNSDFRIVYIKSKKFVDDFVQECLRNGFLKQRICLYKNSQQSDSWRKHIQ